MLKWGQAQDIIYSIHSMGGETGTQNKKELTAAQCLNGCSRPYMRSSNWWPSLGFPVPHRPFSLWSNMFKMELVNPLLPPDSPPASRGLTQNYSNHPSPQPTHHQVLQILSPKQIINLSVSCCLHCHHSNSTSLNFLVSWLQCLKWAPGFPLWFIPHISNLIYLLKMQSRSHSFQRIPIALKIRSPYYSRHSLNSLGSISPQSQLRPLFTSSLSSGQPVFFRFL